MQRKNDYCLYFLVPPIITLPPRDQAARVGEEVTFTCSATGIPDPTIEWFFEETTKVYSSLLPSCFCNCNYVMIEKSFATIQVSQNESRLRVSDVTVGKEGTYKCVASNSPDTSAAASAKLTIYGKCSMLQELLVKVTSLFFAENKHVVQLKLDHISNPSPDGTCHYIDYDKIRVS